MSATVRIESFPMQRGTDRGFFLILLTLIWAGIVAGFVPDMFLHLEGHHVAYAWIVHVHAIAYLGWLALLTTQMALIRSDRRDVHRRVGWIGLGLIVAMVVLGPAAAVIMAQRKFGTPGSDPSFLIIQFMIVANFAVTALAAFALRRNSAAHRRLMILATIFLSSAGFSRWLAPPLGPLLGTGAGSLYLQLFVCSDILLLAIGVHDWLTRRRLQRAYAIAAPLGILSQVLMVWIYTLPGWKSIAVRLIGH